jgi:putative colanic acid biosynthesis acetyltransferase WcaF
MRLYGIPAMRLSTFQNGDFNRGASRLKEFAWLIVSSILVDGPIPGSYWRAAILRVFGAEIGGGVVVKPRVRVKFPWRLEIGANSWIGEGVWIDNLALVRIGHDVCISQAAYLGTGNHDWSSPSFDLVTAGITIAPHCWVSARTTLAPGTEMQEGAILGLGAVGRGRLEPWKIYTAGAPAEIGQRRQNQTGDDW